MSAQTLVEVAAAGLALWAAWKSLPRAPKRDWERLFKVALATVLRGEVEAEGGDVAAWQERLQVLPYHPAGRQPELRLERPDPATLPSPALEGERALVERLRGLPDAPSRWHHMFTEDHRGLDALMSDPALLGPDYDPVSRFGPEATWDAIAAWSEAWLAGLRRRLDHVVLVDFGSPLAEALREAGPGLSIVQLDPPGDDPEPCLVALAALLEDPARRLVLICPAPHVLALLQLLHANPGLRDRLLALLCPGGLLAPPAAQSWLQAHFNHTEMEPELQRAIPYLSWVEVDPARPLDANWRGQRFPNPPVPDSGRRSIDPIDLGPLVQGALPAPVLARATCVLIGFLIAG